MNDNIKQKIQEAANLFNAEKYADARVLLDNLLRESPEESEGWFWAAMIDYVGFKNVDKAFDDVIESLRLDNQSLQSTILAGILLRKGKKDTKSGKKYFDKAMQLSDTEINGYCNIGMGFYQTGHYHDAINTFDEAIEVYDAALPAYYGKGLCYHKIGQDMIAFNVLYEGMNHNYYVWNKISPACLIEQYGQTMLFFAALLASKFDYKKIVDWFKKNVEHVVKMPVKMTMASGLPIGFQYGPWVGKPYHEIMLDPRGKDNSYTSLRYLQILKMYHANTMNHVGRSYDFNPASDELIQKIAHEYVGKQSSENKLLLEGKVVKIVHGIIALVMEVPLEMTTQTLLCASVHEARPLTLFKLYNVITENTNTLMMLKEQGGCPQKFIDALSVLVVLMRQNFNLLFSFQPFPEPTLTDELKEKAENLYGDFYGMICSNLPGQEFSFLDYVIEELGLQELITYKDESDILSSHTENKHSSF